MTSPISKALTRTQKKASFFDYMRTPLEERNESFADLDRRISITYPTRIKWIREFEKLPKDKERSNLTTEEKDKVFSDLLWDLATDPKSPAKYKELYARFRGMLIDKSVVIEIGISAAELARGHIEARRWLNEHGYMEETGMAEMQREQTLLPQALRKDKTSQEGDD